MWLPSLAALTQTPPEKEAAPLMPVRQNAFGRPPKGKQKVFRGQVERHCDYEQHGNPDCECQKCKDRKDKNAHENMQTSVVACVFDAFAYRVKRAG